MTTRLPGIPDEEQIDVLDLGGLAVPVVQMTMHDERTGCPAAHRYLAGELQGIPSEYSGCHFYAAGCCNMNGKAANPCLFHEAESGASWAKVKRWRLLERPDGSTCIAPAYDAAEIAASIGARVIGLEVVRV